ncbi:hypothetical protein WJX72_009151 [[Myrmecia] bisecta]|uniref:HD/PDEase domain-containing protein n=1 Tax=[Myrmecia] bisecta TaxID=41462 RepID=A0AAW1P1L2_9CHLO
MSHSELATQAERFVKQELSTHDGSHDWWHVDRVRKLALELAREEGLSDDQKRTVEIAALLHDVRDWKYSGSETAGKDAVQEFLDAQGVEADLAQQILQIIAGVGFKDELARAPRQVSPELAVVQDADRLDAIGAIGIARCFTFGGRFNRMLHDPAVPPRVGLTKQQYTNRTVEQTTINHFYEKLLTLKGKMKTASGRRRAEQRHAFMEAFLKQFDAEWVAEL